MDANIVKARDLAYALPLILAAAAASASPIQVNFAGTVSIAGLGTTANAGYADGQSVTGQFFIDSVTGVVSGATLGSFSASADNGDAQISVFSSTNDVIFSQGAFNSGGAASNSSITLDLSTLKAPTTSTAVGFLLQSPSALAQQVDFTGSGSSFPSMATYYNGAGNGSGITAVRAYLTSLTVYAAAVTSSAAVITPGQTSTLSVTPAASGTYTYQWYQGVSGDTSHAVAGATGATFTTPALNGTTSYWVQLSGAGGVVENSATITITVNVLSPATDGPLPPWAMGLLGAGLIGIASRRLRKRAAGA
jgi:hypothetical protein